MHCILVVFFIFLSLIITFSFSLLGRHRRWATHIIDQSNWFPLLVTISDFVFIRFWTSSIYPPRIATKCVARVQRIATKLFAIVLGLVRTATKLFPPWNLGIAATYSDLRFAERKRPFSLANLPLSAQNGFGWRGEVGLIFACQPNETARPAVHYSGDPNTAPSSQHETSMNQSEQQNRNSP